MEFIGRVKVAIMVDFIKRVFLNCFWVWFDDEVCYLYREFVLFCVEEVNDVACV